MHAVDSVDSAFSLPARAISHPDMAGPVHDMQPVKVVLETEGVDSAEVATIPGILHQDLHPDGQPRRPMNAFMIFARHRRPAIQAKEPGLKTGDISKRLSHDWKNLEASDKAHYLHQAKILKDEFQSRFPDYVYKRRPNNAASSRRKSSISHMVAEKSGYSGPVDDRQSFVGANGMMSPMLPNADTHQVLYRHPGQDGFPSMYERREASGYHPRPPSAPIRATGAVGYPSGQSPSPFSPHDSNASASVPSHYMRLPQTSSMQGGAPASPSPYWFHPEDPGTAASGPKHMGMSPNMSSQPPLSASSYSSSRPSFVGSWSDHKAGQPNSQVNSPLSSMPPTPAYPAHTQASPQQASHNRTQSLNEPPSMYRQPSPQYMQSRLRQASAPDLHSYARAQPTYDGLYDGRRSDIPEDPHQPEEERELPPMNARSYRFASQGRLLQPDLYHDYAPPGVMQHHSQPTPPPDQRADHTFIAPHPPSLTSHMGLPSLSHYSTSRGSSFTGSMGVETNDPHNPASVYHPQPQAPGRTNLAAHLSANEVGNVSQTSSGHLSHFDRA